MGETSTHTGGARKPPLPTHRGKSANTHRSTQARTYREQASAHIHKGNKLTHRGQAREHTHGNTRSIHPHNTLHTYRPYIHTYIHIQTMHTGHNQEKLVRERLIHERLVCERNFGCEKLVLERLIHERLIHRD